MICTGDFLIIASAEPCERDYRFSALDFDTPLEYVRKSARLSDRVVTGRMSAPHVDMPKAVDAVSSSTAQQPGGDKVRRASA
jgi:hypothetical protein